MDAFTFLRRHPSKSSLAKAVRKFRNMMRRRGIMPRRDKREDVVIVLDHYLRGSAAGSTDRT